MCTDGIADFIRAVQMEYQRPSHDNEKCRTMYIYILLGSPNPPPSIFHTYYMTIS